MWSMKFVNQIHAFFRVFKNGWRGASLKVQKVNLKCFYLASAGNIYSIPASASAIISGKLRDSSLKPGPSQPTLSCRPYLIYPPSSISQSQFELHSAAAVGGQFEWSNNRLLSNLCNQQGNNFGRFGRLIPVVRTLYTSRPKRQI